MSRSTLKSKSGHLRINFTSTIHYQYKALEFVLIIKPRVSHSVGGSWKHEGAPTLPSPSYEFFNLPPTPRIKTDAPHGVPPLKNDAPRVKINPSPN